MPATSEDDFLRCFPEAAVRLQRLLGYIPEKGAGTPLEGSLAWSEIVRSMMETPPLQSGGDLGAGTRETAKTP